MIMNAPAHSPSAIDPVLDTPLPPADEIVPASLLPAWPLPTDPPPGHSELMEALPLPDHSETQTVIEEQIAQAFEPLDWSDPAPVETISTVEIVSEVQTLFTTVLDQILDSLSPYLPSPGSDPDAPAQNPLFEILELARRNLEDLLPIP
jgi:hypothetical protein